jgi:uncharacterized protein (DUF305 family)
MTTICTDNLTDIEYLEHMIPHHQVAVDISIMLQKKTKSAKMQKILRELIRIQTYEIEMMKMMKKKFPQKVSEDINNNKYIKTGSDFMKPNKLGLTQTYCDPHFFDPKGHMKHMEHMKLDDKVYLEHMIPHHQVAVDMSKILIKNTKNDFMLSLAYNIIKSQQEEIIMLNNYLITLKDFKGYDYQSELLI